MMTFGSLHPQESVHQAGAFEVIGKFLLYTQRQGLSLHGHRIPDFRVMPLDDLMPTPIESHSDRRQFPSV
jgi:hypothetical protein